MKVLFLALDVDLSVARGDAVHTLELARHLAARGVGVHLVTATDPSAVPALAGVRHHRRPTGSDLKVVRACAQLVRDEGCAAVYERRLSPKIALGVSRLASVPFVLEVNGTEEEVAMQARSDRSLSRPVKARVRPWMYRRAARIVAVSEPLARIVRERAGLPEDRVVAIPNGVDAERFVPGDAGAAASALGWGAGRHVVFVGNLVAWQGVATLVDAMPSVLDRVPDARLAIVGEGMLRADLERRSAGLGLGDRVRFIGAVPHQDVPSHVRAAAVCAAPFTRERNERIGLSPLKLYEYLACARPVVASDVPGVGDVLRESGAGVPVPPDDPGALADALADLLAAPDRARAMGARGRAWVEANASWARTAERVESVLRDVVGA